MRTEIPSSIVTVHRMRLPFPSAHGLHPAPNQRAYGANPIATRMFSAPVLTVLGGDLRYSCLSLICALALLALSACATPPPSTALTGEAPPVGIGVSTAPQYLDEKVRAELAIVAVTPAQGEPEIDFQSLLYGNENVAKERATKGAVIGGAAGMTAGAYVGIMACISEMFLPGSCSILGPLIAGTIGGAALGGGIGHASASHLTPAQRVVKAVSQRAKDDKSFQKRVMAYASEEASPVLVQHPNLGSQHQRAVHDSALEIGILKIAMPSLGAAFRLEMSAQASLTRVRDRATLISKTYRAQSQWRPWGDWTAEEGRLVHSALEKAYQTLAEQIVDDIFLLYRPAAAKKHAPSAPALAAVGEASAPPKEKPERDDTLFPPELRGAHTTVFVQAESVTPTLRWLAFGGNTDATADEDPTLRNAANVTYEVRLYEGLENMPGDWIPGRLVYRRKGLANTTHTLESPLEPCRKYFWTYRSRFELKRQARVSPWAVGGFGTSESATPQPVPGSGPRAVAAGAGFTLGVLDPLLHFPSMLAAVGVLARDFRHHTYYPFATPCSAPEAARFDQARPESPALRDTALGHQEAAGGKPEGRLPEAPAVASIQKQADSAERHAQPNGSTASRIQALHATFRGKQKKKLLLVPTLVLTMAFENRADKPISGFKGRARFQDLTGNLLGGFPIEHTEELKPGQTVEITQTLYPLHLSGAYSKLKETESATMRFEFELESVQFSDPLVLQQLGS